MVQRYLVPLSQCSSHEAFFVLFLRFEQMQQQRERDGYLVVEGSPSITNFLLQLMRAPLSGQARALVTLSYDILYLGWNKWC
jgi:hypothetical protein|mmetsp:Transcript_38335/g.63647  ORF Transcript_38335/g.63647 Transcript_38335/m.63647 type:complete len:82 (+) Transcript_38335:2394-2639(+)